jgi:hypothetical protein
MGTKKFVEIEKKIIWQNVQKEVNDRLGKNFSINYIQSIYRGSLSSKSVKEILDELIGKKPESKN